MPINHKKLYLTAFATATTFAICGLTNIESAKAAQLGYTLELSPNPESLSPLAFPRLQLTNNSTVNSIVEFDITIGDSNYNFDYIEGEGRLTTNDLGATLIAPDRQNDLDLSLGRTDFIRYSFTNFSPSELLAFNYDIDGDIGLSLPFPDFRFILFELNGSNASDNSQVTVQFDNGSTLSGRLPDFAETPDNIYIFSQSKDTKTEPVPEPSAVISFIAAASAGLKLKRKFTSPEA